MIREQAIIPQDSSTFKKRRIPSARVCRESPKSARKKPSCWRKANKDKERRSGILPLCIKTDMRAAVTMEAAQCRFYVRAIPYVRI